MKKRIISVSLCICILANALLGACFAKADSTEPFYAERGSSILPSALKGASNFQEFYSSAELGYVSDTDDQRSTEICWAFTQNNLIESYLLRTTGEQVDLSEQTMKFETSSEYNALYGHERSPNQGGNEYISIAYLARGGATLESDEVFTESETRTVLPELLEYRGVLTSAPVLNFSESQRELAVEHIKKLVYNYGAAGSGVYYVKSLSYEDLMRTNYYYNGTAGAPNHEITIVGWDDNYPAENFVKTPEGDGAFIVQNSWGSYHAGGTSDLVYISYYDKFICSEIFATTFSLQNDIYDNIYQYDHQGYTGKYFFDGDSDLLYATKYKKSSPGESISAVSTFVTDPGTKIEVLVNTSDGDVTDKSKFRKVYENTFEYAGYYLMEFDGLAITGDEFAVAIRVTSLYGTAHFPVRENLGNFVENATQRKNTCYVTGGDFEDLTAVETVSSFKTRKTMLVMKAFTVTTPFELTDSSKAFTDIKSTDWFKPYTDFAVTYDIFNGTSKETFSPQGALTRAQFVQVLANISKVDTSDNDIKSTFFDVSQGAWYTAAVTWAYESGIVLGVGDRLFAPDRAITREEMCVMLVNYCEKYLGESLPGGGARFLDHDKISSWARDAVYKCKAAGLVSGVGNNMFSPKATATRAQGATIFTQFYKKYILNQ